MTSNFGLGESVVPASSDTYWLSVMLEANSNEIPREVEGIIGKNLGKKSLVTKLNLEPNLVDEEQNLENVIVNEEENLDRNEQHQSISDEDLYQLGSIALEVVYYKVLNNNNF